MCTHSKDNEWYIYLRNKDIMSQNLPQIDGMTNLCFHLFLGLLLDFICSLSYFFSYKYGNERGIQLNSFISVVY